MPTVEEIKAELATTRVVEEGACPCGGEWTRGYTRSEWLVVSHTVPHCDLYMNSDAPDYYAALKETD